MRALPLLLVGCVFVPNEALDQRFDVDGDGFPVTEDCNDGTVGFRWSVLGRQPTGENAPVVDYVAATCGEAVEASFLGGAMGVDLIGVLPLPNPLADGALLGMADLEHVYRLRAPSDLDLVVRLESDAYAPTGSGLELPDPFAALMLNRGAVCSEDSLIPGLPLLEPDSDAAGAEGLRSIRVSATLDLQAGETVFAIVSGSQGAYTLGFECVERGVTP